MCTISLTFSLLFHFSLVIILRVILSIEKSNKSSNLDFKVLHLRFLYSKGNCLCKKAHLKTKTINAIYFPYVTECSLDVVNNDETFIVTGCEMVRRRDGDQPIPPWKQDRSTTRPVFEFENKGSSRKFANTSLGFRFQSAIIQYIDIHLEL